jgi:hypothetical protein
MSWRFLFAAVGVSLLAFSLPSAWSSEPLEQLLRKRVRAAQDAYDGYMQELRAPGFGASRPDVEVIYRWSVRLLKAQQALDKSPKGHLAALEAHQRRMTELERTAKDAHDAVMARVKSGAVPAKQFTVVQASTRHYSAVFYRLEADIWIAQAKEKK